MAKKVKANGKTFTFDDDVTNEQIGQVVDEYFSSQKKNVSPQGLRSTSTQSTSGQPSASPIGGLTDLSSLTSGNKNNVPTPLTEKGKSTYTPPKQVVNKNTGKIDFNKAINYLKQENKKASELYTEDPTLATKREKENLAKQKAEYESKQGERNSFVEDLNYKLASGIDGLGRMVSLIPSSLVDMGLAVNPMTSHLDSQDLSNIIESSTGLPNEYNPISPENAVSQMYKNRQEENAKVAMKGYAGNIEESLRTGNYADASKKLVLNTVESLPIMLGIVASRGAGASEALSLTGVGVGTYGQKYQDLKEQHPELAKKTLQLNAMLQGLGEAGSELVGTSLMYNQAKKLFAKGAKKEAEEMVKGTVGKFVDRMFNESFTAGATISDASGEVANQIWGNAVDKWSGVNPDVDYTDGALDALLISLGTTGAISGSLEAIAGSKSKEAIAKNNEVIADLDTDLSNPDITTEVKRTILEKKIDLQDKISEEVKKSQAKVEALPEEVKSEIAVKQEELDGLNAQIEDSNLTDTTKELIKEKADTLQKDIDTLIETKPKKNEQGNETVPTKEEAQPIKEQPTAEQISGEEAIKDGVEVGKEQSDVVKERDGKLEQLTTAEETINK